MTTKNESYPPRALSSEDGKTWSQSDPERGTGWPAAADESVVKLVVGRLGNAEEDDQWTEVIDALESGIIHRFPNLTHLHVWGLPLKKLGPLPDGLKELDVRNSPDLAVIEDLPTKCLKILVVWNCPALAEIPEPATLVELEEFDFRGLQNLGEAWIHQALEKTTDKLWKLDLSGCVKLTGLTGLKRGLRDLRANGCSQLSGLPGHWPGSLRRLELEDSAITELEAPWEKSMDYVNLAGTSLLTSLGNGLTAEPAHFPRTLFLHGSGIRQPPAVLHGKAANENVSKNVFQYFQQGREVGFGSIRRCKLLFLGNGQAGKTSLALSLEGNPEPAKTAKDKGSTHGIRLRTRIIQPKDITSTDPIRLDHWDFGGQEIYHNAHCRFIQTGSLFLIVWYPDQDGKKTAFCPITKYEDQLHPLRYWLDLVTTRTLGRGRMLIVASHRESMTQDLLNAYNAQREGYKNPSIPLLVHDSGVRKGQFQDIEDWVRKNGSKLVEAEGQKVPAHWQIAEEMVNRWLTGRVAGRTKDVSFEDFRDDFASEVVERIKTDQTGAFNKLREAMERVESAFVIDDENTRQTLHVLTNLGVLYWSEELFGARVIVGQDWALQGIYAALDRTENSKVYAELIANQGRFTREFLAGKVWDRNSEYSGKEVQELLMSFMEDCQISFSLSGERWDGYRFSEPVHVSIKHLPSVAELRAERRFAGGRDSERCFFHESPDLLNKFMNNLHWHAILAHLGKAYGERAEYASDGFYLPENEKGQSVLILVEIKAGIQEESKVFVEARGPDAQELKQDVLNNLQGLLPDWRTGKLQLNPPEALKLAGELTKRVKLFISYARNNDPTVSNDSYPYEDAVNAIEGQFKTQQNIEVLRDQNEIKDVAPDQLNKDEVSVVRFMDKAAKADFVLIVHSGKYWMSQYCMYEAVRSWEVMDELRQTRIAKFLFLDQGPHAKTLGIPQHERDAIRKIWREFAGDEQRISAGLKGVILASGLGDAASNFIGNSLDSIMDNKEQRMTWDPGNLDKVVEWIVRRCGFKVVKK